MTPKPQGGTPAGDATLALRRLARTSGADVQELITLHLLEGLVARIAESPHRDDFVLKGGVLLGALGARRATKDVDLQALRLDNDVASVVARLTEIATVHISDGIEFDPATIRSSIIRDTDAYVGIRLRLTGALGRARVVIGVDVNFGDPVDPPPALTQLPRLVEVPGHPVTFRAYPLTMVLAEKIVTAVDRGASNTRWRDFADVYVLTRRHSVRADQLTASIDTVARYREVFMRPLLPNLDVMVHQAQDKWARWLVRVGRDDELPADFDPVLRSVAAFADPVIAGEATGTTWDPGARRWG